MTPLRLIAAKIILHALHNLRARKNSKTVVVVKTCKAYSKAVTFHTVTNFMFSLSALYFKLNFLCESSDDFLFLDANAD